MISKTLIHALNVVKKETLVEVLDQIEGDEVTAEQLTKAAEFAAAKDGTLEEEVAEEAPMAEGGPPEEEEEDETATSDEPAADAAPLADDATDAALQDPEADAALAALAPLMESTGLDLAGIAAAISENLDAVAAALSGALEEPAADAPLGALPPGMPGPATDLSLSLRTTQTALGTVTKERDELAGQLLALREREADEAVAVYVECGAVLDDAAADLRTLYLSDRKAFGRIAASFKQPVVPTGEQTASEHSGTAPVAEIEITAEDEKDEEIVGLRRMLKAVNKDKATQDKAVRRVLALRREAAI